MFDFDNQDRAKRDEFYKEFIGGGIFFSAVTAIDLKMLNGMKSARNMGPLRKFALLNVLHTPFYIYFYYKISTSSLELKKYMVKKYLILGDEILFKRS